MTHWTDRRQVTDDRIGRANFRALVIVIILIGGAGYVALHQRTTPEPVGRLWTRHWRPALPTIVGNPRVIDGDTIDVSGIRLRLQGIDAPEFEQNCTDAHGRLWRCGWIAARELKAHLAGRELTCAPTGFDRYRRALAVCRLSGGDDVNAWMVRQGWAVAYGHDGNYRSEQDAAQAGKRGIWAGSFAPPAEWRRRHR
jgi:endonuclease YncB( thermonuclease family)